MTRHFWVLVHRYAGLYMAFFLLVSGLTGSILAFSKEIDALLNPPVKITLQSAPQLDEFTLRERAEALLPQITVNMLNFNRKPDEAYTAFLQPHTDSTSTPPDEHKIEKVAIDPYSGQVIARETLSDAIWPITRKNVLGLIIRLHYQLALPGQIGTWLFGIAALVWTIDCFVSVYLTFPLRIRRESSDKPASSLSWWSRWKPAWLVKWRASVFRINFDLHRAGGLWVWLLLLVLAWSSVGFNLNEQVYMPVMKAVFNMPDPFGELPTQEPPQLKPGLDWHEAHRIGKQWMAEQAASQHFKVQREEFLQYSPDKGIFLYGVRSDRDLMDDNGATMVFFSAVNGNYLGLSLPTGQNAGSSLHSWLFALHMAMIWGLPYKLFLCVVGIIIVMLSITGVYIWIKKRQARAFSLSRQTKTRDQSLV